MIRYKELYKVYLEEIDKARSELAKNLETKENKYQREILYQKENVKKANIAYIIAFAFLAIFISPVYTLLSQIGQGKYIWVYFLFCAFIFAIIFALQLNFKRQIKAMSDVHSDKEYESEKIKYQNKCEEIYKIAVFIICINENYYDLLDMEDKDREEKWNEVVERRQDAINESLNFNINVEGYQSYLDTWIKKMENDAE